MWLKEDIKEVGRMNPPSGNYIMDLLNYPWPDSTAKLGDTKNIIFLFKDGQIDEFQSINESESKIIYETISFLKIIKNYYPEFKFIKGEIYMCPPGTKQPPHIDPKIFHRFSHRIHWPIITNKQCFLEIENRSYHLKTNVLYEFNNVVMHRSYNNGTTNRIHLVVDIMAKKYFDLLKNTDYFLKSDDPGTDLDGLLKSLIE